MAEQPGERDGKDEEDGEFKDGEEGCIGGKPPDAPGKPVAEEHGPEGNREPQYRHEKDEEDFAPHEPRELSPAQPRDERAHEIDNEDHEAEEDIHRPLDFLP